MKKVLCLCVAMCFFATTLRPVFATSAPAGTASVEASSTATEESATGSGILDSGTVPDAPTMDLSQLEEYQRMTLDEVATVRAQLDWFRLIAAAGVVVVVAKFLWWLFSKVLFGGI